MNEILRKPDYTNERTIYKVSNELKEQRLLEKNNNLREENYTVAELDAICYLNNIGCFHFGNLMQRLETGEWNLLVNLEGRTILDRYKYLTTELYADLVERIDVIYSRILSNYGNFEGFEILENKFPDFNRSQFSHYIDIKDFIQISTYLEMLEIVEYVENAERDNNRLVMHFC